MCTHTHSCGKRERVGSKRIYTGFGSTDCITNCLPGASPPAVAPSLTVPSYFGALIGVFPDGTQRTFKLSVCKCVCVHVCVKPTHRMITMNMTYENMRDNNTVLHQRLQAQLVSRVDPCHLTLSHSDAIIIYDLSSHDLPPDGCSPRTPFPWPLLLARRAPWCVAS